MKREINPHLVELIHNAALKSFWRKRALARFLQQSGIADSFLATWTEDETKRDLLERLFPKLLKNPRGPSLVMKMARFLAEQKSFPDLEGWEDEREKIADAKKSVSDLNEALREYDRDIEAEEQRKEARRRFKEAREDAAKASGNLTKLRERLDANANSIGTQEAGYEFQRWFYDLADFFEVTNRRPYTHDGREIDGSLTVAGTTYLVELRFRANPTGAPDIDAFRSKVMSKAENTLGIFVSMSGYTAPATKAASGPRTPLLLFDYSHLYLILGGGMRLNGLIERVQRHASQTGEAFLPVNRLGSG